MSSEEISNLKIRVSQLENTVKTLVDMVLASGPGLDRLRLGHIAYVPMSESFTVNGISHVAKKSKKSRHKLVEGEPSMIRSLWSYFVSLRSATPEIQAVASTERFSIIGQQWKELSEKRKAKLTRKYHRAVEQNKLEFREFLNSMDETAEIQYRQDNPRVVSYLDTNSKVQTVPKEDKDPVPHIAPDSVRDSVNISAGRNKRKGSATELRNESNRKHRRVQDVDEVVPPQPSHKSSSTGTSKKDKEKRKELKLAKVEVDDDNGTDKDVGRNSTKSYVPESSKKVSANSAPTSKKVNAVTSTTAQKVPAVTSSTVPDYNKSEPSSGSSDSESDSSESD